MTSTSTEHDGITSPSQCGCPLCSGISNQTTDIPSPENALTTSSLSPAASTAISHLDSGTRWNTSIVNYTFNSITGPYGNSDATQYRLMNEVEKQATVNSMQEFSNVANLTFVDVGTVTPPSQGITFRLADLPSNIAGWAYYPSAQKSDVVIDYAYYTNIVPGQFASHAMLHEIGHAVGLSHPGGNGPNAAYSVDSTIMSYNGGATASRGNGTAPQGLQIYDIAALQFKYGANHTYNAGDNSYDLTGAIKVFTLWDGAGSDTISSITYTGNVVIDLREGLENLTRVGSTKMWIAFGADIESAKAGNGHDTLYGNKLDNPLYGGRGNDSIYGGEGQDKINGNEGNDFLSGDAGNDTLNGGQENDVLQGGAGVDNLYGNTGDDTLYGDDDQDTLEGNDGNDTLNGGNGDDSLSGAKHDDLLLGGAGNDLLSGGSGNDQMIGSEGNDTIQGNADLDMLVGGAGADRLSGGSEGDIFVFAGFEESTDTVFDTITDFVRGQDHIQLTGLGFNAVAMGAGSGGQLGYAYVGKNTVIVDADSDFSLTLTGKFALTDADFIF